ncbi:hypothetical protein E3N88_29869 [Mikania micrantha]|uniref:Uncharacterized protein n=1 Tax=Mikania micrantha TaxID=192012 RepID=A0A5N6MKN7_9ASTR|nr:hypothetical protein E3N88_29869 [Mikania micrantha]
MDLDYSLRHDAFPPLDTDFTVEQKKVHDQWERSNRMSLMVIKNSISPTIRGSIPNSENVKVYLDSVEEQFKGTSKTNVGILILRMLTTKYSGTGGVREHIMMMNDMANQLKTLDMEISKGFLVHFIMTSLPSQFDLFKINYNTQKEKWKMSELIAMCVQEEERLKLEKPDFAHLTTSNLNKKKGSFKTRVSREISQNPISSLLLEQVLAHSKAPLNVVSAINRGTFKGTARRIPYNKEAGKKLANENNLVKNKRKRNMENSSKLWHKRLGHISQERMNRLVKDGVLPKLDVSDFEKCVQCIKGKMTKTNKKGSTRRKKPNLNYLKLWGCPAEAKRYNPQSKKLDMKTVSCFFIGYPEHYMGYRFYCPSHTTRIVKHTEFLEMTYLCGSVDGRRIDFQEGTEEAPITYVPIPINQPFESSLDSSIPHNVTNTEEPSTTNPVTSQELNEQQPQELPPPLRRSSRPRRPITYDDFVTYLHETDFDLGKLDLNQEIIMASSSSTLTQE